MKSIMETLAAQPIFADIDESTLTLLAGCARHPRIHAGTRLFTEGAPATDFHLIREGRVALGIYTPHAGLVTLETRGPGQIVGWSWLFPPYRWHFDAEALEPLATIQFDGHCIRGKCDSDPVLGYDLMKRFSTLLDADLRSTHLRLLDVYHRAPTS